MMHKIHNSRKYYESGIDCFVKITNDNFEFNVVLSELLNGFSRCDVFIDRTNKSVIFKLNNDGEYTIVTHKGRRNKCVCCKQIIHCFIDILKSKRYEVKQCEGGVMFTYEVVPNLGLGF